MTVGVSELSREYSSTDATQYISVASYSPAANSFLVVPTICRHGTTAPGVTPVNAFGGTWVESIGEQVDAISAIGCWTLQCGASPGTAQITWNVDGGVTAIGFGHHVLQCTGHDPSGTVVDTKLGPTGTTSGTSSITMNGIGSATDAVITMHFHRGQTASTSEAGWSPGTDLTGASPAHGSRTEWRTDRSDLTATMTFTSVRWQTLGIQIKELVSGAPAEPTKFRRNRSNMMRLR